MLDLLTAASVWLDTTGVKLTQPAPTAIQTNWLFPNDPQSTQQVNTYLNRLTSRGFTANEQGVWLQTSQGFLASHQGSVPLSAASIAKSVTSLMALKTWGPSNNFKPKLGRLAQL
jgi:serine-type D-Ala-D-Ala carboxypeptidase/endopeptidase (penicillin-binding protein 4)